MAEKFPKLAPDDWKRIAELLYGLGACVREGIRRSRADDPFANVAAIHKVTSADTIYEIDRISEDVLLGWFSHHWPDDYPADIIAEGVGDETAIRFPPNAPGKRLTLIIDPIDGTRGLMYDKRSAWMLAGAAEAENPGLGDLRAGAMVEIPTSRQQISDGGFAWDAGSGRFECETIRSPDPAARSIPWELLPSTATDLRHGFASFASFFPEGREEIQRIELTFLRKHLHEIPSGTPLVFTDQYISTGGQLFELLAGRDRLVADLRPLVFDRFGPQDGLCCHPYDLACLPLVRASGCIIEDPWGAPLRSQLDTVSPVAWVGYANQTLAKQLRPLLRETLTELGYRPR